MERHEFISQELLDLLPIDEDPEFVVNVLELVGKVVEQKGFLIMQDEPLEVDEEINIRFLLLLNILLPGL